MVIIGSVAFVFSGFVFDVIIFGPKSMDFPTYRFFCDIATAIGVESDFCKDELPFYHTEPYHGRTVLGGYLDGHLGGVRCRISLRAIRTLEVYQPGLHPKERKHSRGFILIASALFFMGVLFGYYVVAPLSINFLGTYQVSEQVLNEFDIGSYISAVRTSVIACGVLFELAHNHLFFDQGRLDYPRNHEKIP